MDCVSEDWKQEEETGYWDTEHCVSEDFVNDWKATEESGYWDLTTVSQSGK